MLILDYQHWERSKVPIICEMYKDERCPCLQNCFVHAICSKTCQPMRDYITINIAETLAYLREHMGKSYYDKIETGQNYEGKAIFEGLVNLHYHTVLQDDGIYDEWACIMNRFYYTMKRSYEISKNHCKADPTAQLHQFFIGV